MTFDDWYDTVVKHVTPADIYQWMYEAWDAGQQAEREACAKVCDELYKHDRKESGYDEGWNDGLDIAEQAIRARGDHD